MSTTNNDEDIIDLQTPLTEQTQTTTANPPPDATQAVDELCAEDSQSSTPAHTTNNDNNPKTPTTTNTPESTSDDCDVVVEDAPLLDDENDLTAYATKVEQQMKEYNAQQKAFDQQHGLGRYEHHEDGEGEERGEDEGIDFDNIEPDLDRARDAKQRGNQAFGKGDYETALECYSEALLFCPDDVVEERVLYHNNKCATHIMMKDWEDGIFEADCVLELDERNIKALSRRAKCYESMESYQEAIDTYKILVELEPNVKLHKQKVTDLTKIQEEKFEKQKEEMIGQLKGWGNTFLGWFGMSTDNFQMQQDPATGSYSVNFVQNPGEAQQQQQQQQQQKP